MFTVEPTDVLVSGKTYAIGSGARETAVVIGTETVRFGPAGVELPTTTIAPPRITGRAETITADGIVFTVEPTDVLVSGKTYAIGSGARETAVVIGTETVRFGSGGVGLPSTTIKPEATGLSGGAFEGGAERKAVGVYGWIGMAGLGILGLVLL